MIDGVLIAESLSSGADLAGLSLHVTRIARVEPGGVAPDQPPLWTVLFFTADDADAEALQAKFAGALDAPGWYLEFHNATEIFVAFPGRCFRYPRGDRDRRAEVLAHGRATGVPEAQMHWVD